MKFKKLLRCCVLDVLILEVIKILMFCVIRISAR